MSGVSQSRSGGADVTPDDKVSDEVACAITVTTLLKKVYPETPLITGTYTLYDYLSKPTSNYIKLKEPEAGCIVISPTGMGKPMTNGHVGIFMEDGTIASNTSFGVNQGKLMKSHTLATWTKYYGGRGYPVFFFKHI